eukprot:TRINITY_DN59287_c0_g1_i2.p1 TRINITY_DN59287_c0_g1~~TRINITY_DN59287_c0_g1_i2.p1  ORF type:complete len:166 (-),score=57.51 TRINITY_DN59287_c0_g1_i2:164-631(-)
MKYLIAIVVLVALASTAQGVALKKLKPATIAGAAQHRFASVATHAQEPEGNTQYVLTADPFKGLYSSDNPMMNFHPMWNINPVHPLAGWIQQLMLNMAKPGEGAKGWPQSATQALNPSMNAPADGKPAGGTQAPPPAAALIQENETKECVNCNYY